MMTRTIMSLAPLLVMAAVYAWFGLTVGKLFVQLGAESWKAWVPIINQLEMLKLVNRPSSQIFIIAFVPLYGLYVYYQVLQEMSSLCGRDERLALLGLLLPPVWAAKMMDGDPFAPVVLAGLPPAQPVAWPMGADPTVSGPTWPAAPAPPGDPFYAAQISADQAQPPRMPLQPTPVPVQQTMYPVAAPLLVQPGQQPPVMAPPVMLPAAPVAPAPPTPQAVAAQAAPPEIPVECTVLIDRAASQPWSLVLDDGRRFDLWASSVLIGRAPSTVDPGTQVLAVSDETCTISKVHARLDLVGGMWHVTDAGSTNGIIVTRAGRAFMVPPGTSATVDEQLVLGSVGMRLVPGR